MIEKLRLPESFSFTIDPVLGVFRQNDAGYELTQSVDQ